MERQRKADRGRYRVDAKRPDRRRYQSEVPADDESPSQALSIDAVTRCDQGRILTVLTTTSDASHALLLHMLLIQMSPSPNMAPCAFTNKLSRSAAATICFSLDDIKTVLLSAKFSGRDSRRSTPA